MKTPLLLALSLASIPVVRSGALARPTRPPSGAASVRDELNGLYDEWEDGESWTILSNEAIGWEEWRGEEVPPFSDW